MNRLDSFLGAAMPSFAIRSRSLSMNLPPMIKCSLICESLSFAEKFDQRSFALVLFTRIEKLGQRILLVCV